MKDFLKYRNYRDMAKARFIELKATDPSYSYREFSRRAGFGSPNYLLLVIAGKRGISPESVSKFIAGLKLEGDAAKHFAKLAKDELTVRFIQDMYVVDQLIAPEVA